MSRRPSTTLGNPTCSCTACSILPNACDSGTHRYCRSSAGHELDRLPRDPDVGPAPVRQLDALGPAGGPGRVDDRGQVLGSYGDDRLVDRSGVVDEVLRAERLQVVHAEHPLAVGLSVEGDHPEQVGQVVPLRTQLRDLHVVLGERDPRPAVGQDVGHRLLPARRVDRRRRPASAHDGQVGVQPLDACRAGDRHPLLGLDPQCQQARCDRLDHLAGLPPAHRHPGPVAGEPVGLPVRIHLDLVVEHPRHRDGGCRVAVLVGRPRRRRHWLTVAPGAALTTGSTVPVLRGRVT